MKTLIVANWKLNPTTQKEAKKLFDAVKKKAKSKNAEVVVCPPFVYLPLFKGVALGAQNIFWEEKGAFTGEISAMQLKDLKIEYVILGHSERRRYFAETDEMVNKKIKQALLAGLKVILCIGESSEELQHGKKQEVLEKQITEGLKNISRAEFKNVTIAYEPIWAIGTGKSCSPDETLGCVLLIRKIISQLFNRELANATRILYGGSVNSANSSGYLKSAGVNGFLIGGASLNAEEFVKIVKSAS